MSAACLVCGGPTSPLLDDVRDNRFGSPGTWSIRRCAACDTAQTDPLPTQGELIALYEAHYNYGGEAGTAYTGWRERLFASPLYRWFLRIDGDVSFHSQRGVGRLLDIGCNEGRGLSLYARGGFTVEGLELNANAAAAARRRGFTVHEVDIVDFRPAAPFDRAVLSNVLEHALDPRAMLKHVHRILKPSGEVWISLPNRDSWLRRWFGRSWINWHVPFHITHFSAPALRQLLSQHGFEVVSERQVTPALWVAQSALAWRFDRSPRLAKLTRNPLAVVALMGAARGLLFPLWWLAHRLGHGDCLVIKARRR